MYISNTICPILYCSIISLWIILVSVLLTSILSYCHNIILKWDLALLGSCARWKNGSPAVFLLDIIEKEAGMRACCDSRCRRVIRNHSHDEYIENAVHRKMAICCTNVLKMKISSCFAEELSRKGRRKKKIKSFIDQSDYFCCFWKGCTKKCVFWRMV